MSSEYDYVRRSYGVDPKPGARVRHTELRPPRNFGVIAPEAPGAGHYVMVVFDGAPHALPCHPTSLDYEPDDRDRLPMWSIYDRPRDFPRKVVARRWMSLPQPIATHTVETFDTIEACNQHFSELGLHFLPRNDGDDASIVGVWL